MTYSQSRVLLELLAINYISPERKIIFVPLLLKFFHVLVVLSCMGAHFLSVELDNAIRFITLFRMSGFLWHSSRWACQFGCSGHEVLACSLNTDLNYVTTMPFLEPLSKVATTFRRKIQKLFGCILIEWYVTPAALSPKPEALCWISSKMSNFSCWIPKIPSGFSFDFALFVLSLYI